MLSSTTTTTMIQLFDCEAFSVNFVEQGGSCGKTDDFDGDKWDVKLCQQELG